MVVVEQDASFGQLVRFYRRQCADPMRGGLLTQERLGELIGEQMGDAGYTGAAVSEWERDRSKIHADDRLVLLSLISVLALCGGLGSSKKADDLLAAGNYRHLDENERGLVFRGREDLAGYEERSEVSQVKESPAGGAPPSRRSKQLILLDKVCSFWVEGVLEKSVQGMPLIDIPQTNFFEAIDHPWGQQLGMALISSHAEAAPGSAILETYGQADRALLILGHPGSGKTSTLISLAKGLIHQARDDWTKPIPVILDLASWGRLPLPLSDWVVDELSAKYQIPRRYGRKWVAANELVVLLDGLDSLPPASRRNCIEAINAFRVSHGLTGIAVCCRSREYLETGQLLNLNAAIELHPLGDEQLAEYLAAAGSLAEGLGEILDRSPELWEMAHNPLMLNIMTAVFANSDNGNDRSQEMSEAVVSVEMLFDAYIQRMFARRAAHEQYTRERTTEWLSWLAAGMNEHNQTIFLIEQMQPSWLHGERLRRIYMILAGAITGAAGGLIMWLLWRLLRYTLPQLPAPTSETVSGILGVTVGAAEPLTIIMGNVVLGLVVGVTLMLLFDRRLDQPVDAEQAQRQRRQQVLIIGLETGVITTLFVLIFSEPLLALAWGVAEGFMYAASARYIFGWTYKTEVRTVEALGWSWPHAATGALVGLALAAVAEVIESLLYGYNGAARTVVTLVVAGFVMGGLRGRSAESKNRPNQGVWLSLRNAFIAALVLSVTMAALAWFIRDPLYAWQIGILAAVIAAAIMGASVFVKHFLLRAMLRYQRLVPWRYSRFLDYASHLVLLRKVGNGYIFIHGLMQAYFARSL